MSTIEHIVAPEELMAYLDGELPPERAASVRAHLSDCASCQSLAADLRGVSDELRAWEEEAPADSVRVPAVFADTQNKRRFRWTQWSASARHASLAASVIVVLGGAMWLNTFMVQRLPPTAAARDLPDTEAVGVAASGRGVSRETVLERAKVPGMPTITLGGAPGQPRASAASPEGATVSSGRTAVTQSGGAPRPGAKIIRTATLTVVVSDVPSIRSTVDRILQKVGGFIGHIQISGEANAGWVRATLRVPALRLDETVAALRALGRVVDETQSGDDVADQLRDLEVRLANSRNTEKRLNEILRNRTGDVSDVLQVEREIARVREEIERMDAERQNLEHRVAYATITLQVNQERQASLDLGPLPMSTKFRNAIVDGLRDAFESVLGLMLFLLRVGPMVLLWVVVLWWPVRFAIRRGRDWGAPTQ